MERKKKPAKRRPSAKNISRFGKKTESLRRAEDNTVYAYKCTECEGHWKIYQNPYHQGDCSQK